ncbi:MAG TPA: sugar ABC transporter permease [Candidatus Pygmaiobacter gallistercoris]|nr:sugar ABC transporter permease [Candidatus Pygmaiobacter gallistercoris]
MSEKKISFSHLGKHSTYIALVAVLLIFGVLTEGRIFTPMNITNNFIQNGYLFLLTISLFFCILTGNTDLSVGSIIGLVGAVIGILYVNLQVPMILAVFCGLLVGVLIGAFHGVLITKFGFAPFIVTLAGNFAYRGIVQYLLQGGTLGPLAPQIKSFANGYILSDLRVAGINLVCLLVPVLVAVIVLMGEMRRQREAEKYGMQKSPVAAVVARTVAITLVAAVISYFWNAHKGMPIIVLCLVVIIAIYNFIANNTVLGRHVYAVGGNCGAAALSGVNVNRVMFLVFFNSAFVAAIAALVVAGRVGATSTNAGDGYQMDAIAACYIGGCSGSGGSGSLVKAIVGAFVVSILLNGMTLMGLGSDVQQMVKGLVLLAAVTFDVFARSRSEG